MQQNLRLKNTGHIVIVQKIPGVLTFGAQTRPHDQAKLLNLLFYHKNIIGTEPA